MNTDRHGWERRTCAPKGDPGPRWRQYLARNRDVDVILGVMGVGWKGVGMPVGWN